MMRINLNDRDGITEQAGRFSLQTDNPKRKAWKYEHAGNPSESHSASRNPDAGQNRRAS
jgi:hypothetical protein